MVDYVAVLKRTIDALPRNSPEIRERVYSKARTTVQSKLAMINPAPSQALIDKQMNGLELAISTVEADFTVAIPAEAQPVPAAAEVDPLMDVLRGMPVAPPAQAVFQTVVEQPYETEPVDDHLYEQPHDVPAEAETASRMPHASNLQFDEAPAQTQMFDDVFGRENAHTPSSPFAMPSLDDPVLLPQFSRAPKPRAKPVRLLMPLLGLAVLAVAGAIVWTQRDAIITMLEPEQLRAGSEKSADANVPAAQPVTETPVTPSEGAAGKPAENTLQKFTQRLNADGTENDPGAGNGSGEQSVAQLEPASPEAPAAATTEPATTAQPAAAGAPATAPEGIAVGQKAIFYEERTSGSEGSARPGDVVWSIVRESPGNDRPPEAAVRGELSVPEAGLNVRMTLRRNADPTLPASHILELIMTVPEDFAGGTIEDVQRVNLKPTEESAGAPLVATPVKVADKYFLVALENSPAAIEANLQLLRDQSWIDLPVVYRSGRRALFTMEKGLIGDQVFKQALDAWAAAPLQ